MQLTAKNLTILLSFLLATLLASPAAAGGYTHIPLTSTYLCGVVHNHSPYTMKITSTENESHSSSVTPNLWAFWNWSDKFTQPEHKQTVWCKQRSLGKGASDRGRRVEAQGR